MIIRQNASTDPGTSAHLMIVELLENARTAATIGDDADRCDGVEAVPARRGDGRRSRRGRRPVDVGLDEDEVGGRHDGAQVALDAVDGGRQLLDA